MAREPCVYLSVDRDKLTGGIQLSIDDENGGYRIAGPKYCGMSVSLLEHHLDARDIAELVGTNPLPHVRGWGIAY